MTARKLLSALAMLVALAVVAPAQAGVERPPQFIVMAFDNCTELERWQDLADFAAEMNKDGARVHFTFFVSGINFIADAGKAVHEGPHQRRGYSRINFGGSAADVARRVAYINDMHRRGHEIASHAVGHFNGAAWSAADWGREFRSFQDAFENVAHNNALPGGAGFAFPFTDVTGFRAPYLARGAGLYAALRDHRFRYDTSAEAESTAWPEKRDATWRFNLASIRLNGSGKRLLSMDYNFFMAQSRGAVDARRHEQFREQMLQTYLDYFKANYAGNRAPLNIGHHFFNYQGGAYNEALKTFARTVCRLPEVQCTTYAKLADFMDRQDAETLAAYRNGDFARAGAPALNLAAR